MSTGSSLLVRGQFSDLLDFSREAEIRHDPRSGYDAAAPYYDDWHWQLFWRTNEWPFIGRLLENKPPPRSVLDVGVGTGVYLDLIGRQYPPTRLSGFDVSEGMLSRARNRLGDTAWLVCADARAIPFNVESFDLVLMNRVASHIEDLTAVTSEITHVMQPGSLLVISDVSPEHNYSCTSLPIDQEKISVETYKHSMKEWEEASKSAGLQLEYSFEINRDNAPDPETYPGSNGALTDKPVGFVWALRKA